METLKYDNRKMQYINSNFVKMTNIRIKYKLDFARN